VACGPWQAFRGENATNGLEMKTLLNQILILVSLCGLVACAAPGEPQDRVADAEKPRRGDCIHEPSIRGYQVLDEQNLIVEAGRRDYHVELFRRAHGIDSSWGIVFDTPNSRVCESFSEIRFRGPFGAQETVRIRSIRKLTPEEEEDLLIRFGKKEPEIEQTPAPQDVEGADVEELDTDDDE
jgi:hypothetical protein